MPTELITRCPHCPPDGGQIVASIPGQAPGRIAADRARDLTGATGTRHHDHYDPARDAFVVIADPDPKEVSR